MTTTDPMHAPRADADLLAFGRRALRSQAFSRLLGAELDRFERGRAVLSLPLQPQLRQHQGLVHGGVLSYLADNALTFAGGSVLGDALTVEYKINYLRPLRDGARVAAEAVVLGHTARQAVCRCEVYVLRDGVREVCAAAQGTIRAVGAPR
jgi:uncharacterized protein (TIGR00369 family)